MKLKCDEPLSKYALVSNERRYMEVYPAALRRLQQVDAARHAANTGRRRRGLLAVESVVGRCRLTLSNLR